jgi:hypothetical protein
MTIALFATAVVLLIVGILWAEDRLGGLYVDNAFIRARDACARWRWTRHDRANNAARPKARE